MAPKPGIRVCTVLLMFMWCGILSSQQNAKAVSVVLRSPQGPFKTGQPIELNLVFSNTSDKDVSITVSPGYEDATYNCKALARGPGTSANDEYLEPTEKPSKTHTRSAFGYTLVSNKSLNMYYDLTRKYSFDEPGIYSVKLRCGYYAEASSTPVFSNPISIIITP